MLVGYTIVYMSRSGQSIIILALGSFLIVVVIFKLLFAIIYWIISKWNSWIANSKIKERKKYLFEHVNQNLDQARAANYLEDTINPIIGRGGGEST